MIDGGGKLVMMNIGLVVMVLFFVKNGDKIIVNMFDGVYKFCV